MYLQSNYRIARWSVVLIAVVNTAICSGEEPQVVTVDIQKTIKSNVNKGSASVNLCWLLDSDKNQSREISMRQALDEMGVGSLRFPYGHLADNYLWHTPPFSETSNGLRPRVATIQQAPADWKWAVDKEGAFKSAMDFDEYMELCSRLSAQPLVVVNLLSYKYKGGPAYDDLKKTAVEWVKYARRKGYKVVYWQLGNEVDHHPDLISRKEYVKSYIDFTIAMKQADPSILCGPGILTGVRFFKDIIEKKPQLIDFVSCHQYMYKYVEQCSTYELWKNNHAKSKYILNVAGIKKAVSLSSKPDLPILITETGITPAKEPLGKINNTYKALWWFELLMNEICVENVAYIYNWGTHSPWSGGVDRDHHDADVLLRIDNNERKPTGEIIRLVNKFLLERMVETSAGPGYLRTYATADTFGRQVNIFLMNKDDAPRDVVINLKNDASHARTFRCLSFSGTLPDDRDPRYEQLPAVSERKDSIKIRLQPLSITVLKQTN